MLCMNNWIYTIIYYHGEEQMSEFMNYLYCTCKSIQILNEKFTQIYMLQNQTVGVFKNIHYLGAKHSELCKRKKSQYIFLVKQTLYFDTLAPVFSP